MLKAILTNVMETEVTDVEILKLEIDEYGNEHLYFSTKQYDKPTIIQINFNYNK